MTEPSVSHARHDGIQVLRCRGDLRHPLAPAVYRFLEHCLEDDPPRGFVIDLTAAHGMDSTCLGLLGHIANRMQEINGSRVRIVLGESDLLTLLTHMGFDDVFDMVDEQGVTPPEVIPLTLDTDPDMEELRRAMLHSHRTLMAMNENNRAVFADVVRLLEQEGDDPV